MKLHQLRCLCEIVDHNLNVTGASQALGRTQPGVSRYVRELEGELGGEIFTRMGKRFTGLTPFGEQVLVMARAVLLNVRSIEALADDRLREDRGSLVVATTHTHARYLLPAIVSSFLERFPGVDLALRQGNPTQVANWVETGKADISIASAPLTKSTSILLLPSARLRRVVLMPKGHPLELAGPATLQDLARFPMITYDKSYSGSSQVLETFESNGLEPHIALSATDADVMKAYVRLGLGVAIVAEVVHGAADDDLAVRDVTHLFGDIQILVGVARQHLLRSYAYEFITMFDPCFSSAQVRRRQLESASRQS